MKRFPNISNYEYSVRNEFYPNGNYSYKPTFRTSGEIYFEPGNRAVVYKVLDPHSQQRGIKFFLVGNDQMITKYHSISSYLNNLNSKYFVHFEFINDVIFCTNVNADQKENYFPGVIMEWADGVSLGSRIEQMCKRNNKKGLKELAEKFKDLSLYLLDSDFAHGDLKHDNIVVNTNNDLKLIDYDGMFIPNFNGQISTEIGTPSFQHPNRTNKDFNKNVDDFSILVIYTSLLALSKNPKLYNDFNDQQNIIFTSEDFEDANSSELLSILEQDDEIRPLILQMKSALKSGIIHIPNLKNILVPPEEIETDTSYYAGLFMELTSRNADLESSVYQLKKSITKLQNDNAVSLSNLATYKAEISTLKRINTQLERNNKEQEKQQSHLQDNNYLLSLEVNSLKKAKDEAIVYLRRELENEKSGNYTTPLSIASLLFGIAFLISLLSNPGCDSRNVSNNENAAIVQNLNSEITQAKTSLLAKDNELALLKNSLDESKRKLQVIYKNKPFLINSIDFENTKNPGVYSNSFRYSDITYISPRLNITPLAEHLDNDLMVKYINPFGTVNRNPRISPKGYSFEIEKWNYNSSSTIISGSGWGNEDGGSYEYGTHRVEIWYKGNLIGSDKFKVY